ncbi:hypothetical protein ACFSVM_00915 [Paenibacillus shunpengii]|uniref:Uncharacterized protein n=1 Tax=Paenibacillus shunpengii TaxID=2054424 RepID=A0ABW5SH30_9BACL|nr:hypothetical protein [Paenibacillus sp. PDC88]SDX43840.1 hypothetical protein SAMN05518848_107176 [Paenibacillus sp. PDC88]
MEVLVVILLIVIVGVTPLFYRMNRRIGMLEERIRQLEDRL